MPFVLDASVAASWAFEDENRAAATVALGRAESEPVKVPALWYFELRNSLIVNERRGRITPSRTSDFLRSLSRLRILVDADPDETHLLALARQHGLTVYDAAYLELADRTGLELATLDAALIRAARAENVRIVA